MCARRNLLVAVSLLAVHPAAWATGSVVIQSRESTAANNVWAGSGGAVRSSDASDSSAALTGTFTFSDTSTAFVTEDDPFSTGDADASGTISVTDTLLQDGPRSLSFTATRTSAGTANHNSGPSNATTRQHHRVVFTIDVLDTPVQYELTGQLGLGPETNPGFVELRRPFTSNVKFRINEAGALNETGTLDAGRTYRFELRMTDDVLANASNPVRTTGSSASINFTISKIPCLGDTDVDGDTDLNDLATILADFGCSDSPCAGDVDGSGTTDLTDLALALSSFGCS